MANTGETTILEEGGVKITNRRAIIGLKTYAMANITSVSMTYRNDRGGIIPTILLLSGVIIVAFTVPLLLLGNNIL